MRSVIAWLGADALEQRARGAGVSSARWLSGIYDFSGDQTGYARRMAEWLTKAPPGTVLMCHPASAAADSQAPVDPIAAARRHEMAYLQSPTFADQLRSQGIKLARGGASTLGANAF